MKQMLKDWGVAITLAVLGANLLVDVVYVWLDPRARKGT